ncbi:MAG: GyrI-like domain-containing protein [Coriobacteriia bacterium]|nr:GyrI-like domain-containing protein [Coriobacteriia bacterium]
MLDPSIKQAEPMTVAFVAMTGRYEQIPIAFGILYGWVSSRGLEPVGMPLAVYLNDPQIVPESEALWEVWAPVAGDPAEEGPDEKGLGIKKLPAMTVASVIHRGPYDTVAPTYEALGAWVAEQGYVLAGPPREAYMSDPATAAPEDCLTEIHFPVQRA